METETPRLVADDLFAGAGGWDIAADWLDVHARGVENMPQARATREAAGLTTIHDDVWTFKPRYVGTTPTASGLIASPPCQTFSQAGKGAGRKALDDVLEVLPQVATMSLADLRTAGAVFGDDRTALVLTPLWFAIHHPYRWLAWEQVPTVLPVWEACAEVLREHGWNVWTGCLQAEQYGVPQTRRRAFLIASRDHQVTPPTPTHSRYYSRTPERLDAGVAKWVSMADVAPWRTRDSLHNHRGAGMELRSGPRSGRPADRPAFCIRAWMNARMYWLVGAERQGPSTNELGLLQSFPDGFPFAGSKTRRDIQVGNAVPPLLAAAALSAALGEPFVPPAMTTETEAAQPALAVN